MIEIADAIGRNLKHVMYKKIITNVGTKEGRKWKGRNKRKGNEKEESKRLRRRKEKGREKLKSIKKEKFSQSAWVYLPPFICVHLSLSLSPTLSLYNPTFCLNFITLSPTRSHLRGLETGPCVLHHFVRCENIISKWHIRE